MLHNVLLTGASDYLGGTLLERWSSFDLPEYGKLFALVRSPSQADAVREHGANPLILDVKSESAVLKAITTNNISIVLFLIDASSAESQIHFLHALAEVGKATGLHVHFVHVWNDPNNIVVYALTEYLRQVVLKSSQATQVPQLMVRYSTTKICTKCRKPKSPRWQLFNL
jgi:hypothetical protein